MIEANINVEKEISIKALIKEKRLPVLLNNFRYIIGQLSYAWIVVAVVDYFTNNINLIIIHLLSLLAFSIVATFTSYFLWKKELYSSMKDINYKVQLDDSGVTILKENVFHKWDHYKYYKEFDDYLLIRDINGISVLPKKKQLLNIIQFTKDKIPNKAPQPTPKSGAAEL